MCFLKISNLNRSAYGIGVGAIGAVSLLSANPLGFLQLAKIMQFLTLFMFIPFNKYPVQIKTIFIAQGIFTLDFVTKYMGLT